MRNKYKVQTRPLNHTFNRRNQENQIRNHEIDQTFEDCINISLFFYSYNYDLCQSNRQSACFIHIIVSIDFKLSCHIIYEIFAIDYNECLKHFSSGKK